ncbi:MAG: HAMP domain-containing protein [Polyangia bacterium]
MAVFLLGERASDSNIRMLDEQVRLGEQALVRQWALHRAERQRAFAAVASQPALREALSAGNRSVLSAFVQQARTAGADAVALVNRQGQAMSQDGPSGLLLPELTQRSHVPESGALFALANDLFDVFRLPVGTDAPVGYLIATSRIDSSRLKEDLEPFGVFAAVAVDNALITSLPPGVLTTPRWGPDPQQGLPELAARYRLRIATFDNGRVLLAAPLVAVRAFGSDFLRQIAGLLVIVVAGSLAVALVVLSRITGPIEGLQQAADMMSLGHLTRSRAMMKPLADRKDEIGALARTFMAAAQRLHSVVSASQRLIRDIDATVLVVERSAGTVSQGAQQQEERLKELLANLGPLTVGLEQTMQGLQDARSLVVQLALHSSNADQSQAVVFTVARRVEAIVSASASSGDVQDGRSYRTATVLQQVSALVSAVNDQRDALARIREQTQVLRTRLDAALESQVREQHHGQFAQRAGAEIGRVARLHAQESEALRVSAEQLRTDIEELQGLLHTVDTREDGRASYSGDRARLSVSGAHARAAAEARERSLSGSGTRRPVRVGSSSPSARPIGAAGPAGSSPGVRPVGGVGSSSPASKPLSTGRSSGTNKPVPSAVSARDGGVPQSAVSARGMRMTSPAGATGGPLGATAGPVSSGQLRPVAAPSAVSGRSYNKPAPSAVSAAGVGADGTALSQPSTVSARNVRSPLPSAVSSGGLVPAVKPSAMSGGAARSAMSASGLRAVSGPRSVPPPGDAGQSGVSELPNRRR